MHSILTTCKANGHQWARDGVRWQKNNQPLANQYKGGPYQSSALTGYHLKIQILMDSCVSLSVLIWVLLRENHGKPRKASTWKHQTWAKKIIHCIQNILGDEMWWVLCLAVVQFSNYVEKCFQEVTPPQINKVRHLWFLDTKGSQDSQVT